MDQLVQQLDGDRVAITEPSDREVGPGMGVVAAGSGNPSAGL